MKKFEGRSSNLSSKKSIPKSNLDTSKVSKTGSSYQKPKATSRYAQLNQLKKNAKSKIGSFRPSVMGKAVSSNYVSRYKFNGSQASRKDNSSSNVSTPLNLSQSSRRTQSMRRQSYLPANMLPKSTQKRNTPSGFHKSSERKQEFKPRMSRYAQERVRKNPKSTSLPQGAFKSTLHKNLAHNKNMQSQ